MRTRHLPFEILHEDDDMIVIDKPVGLLTTHTRLLGRAARAAQPTAENFLNNYVRKGQRKSHRRVFLVHRLDRETSGVLLFVKSASMAEALRADWNALTRKTYLARVEGVLADASGTFESYLRDDPRTFKVVSVADPKRGKRAVTQWKKIAATKRTTLVEVALKSGRKNQIRVHFADAGNPVVGDVKYGAKPADRLHLHALRLTVCHPFSHQILSFESQQNIGEL